MNSWWSLLLDLRRAERGGTGGIAARQRDRLADIVNHARAASPYYRRLYQHLPNNVVDVTSLPVTDKAVLMANFDDWSTDREITLEKARAFAADSSLIGERFLGKYTLATTSGTTGRPGIFVSDDDAMRITTAIMLRMLRSWLGVSDVAAIAAAGGRLAMVADVGHHSATSVAAARFTRLQRQRERVQILSVRSPLAELVQQLNEFQPAVVAPYASMARLLASEQEVGRLRIRPVLVALVAEGLPLPEYDRIAKAFDTIVGNSYAATECPFLSFSCKANWLHVNADWVFIEPVDRDCHPVAEGTQSYTVLVTNLANRLQPILRYDLGDSILMRPDRCECGSPLPAIRVRGRSADVLLFAADAGGEVAVPPLAFEIDHVQGVELYQIVQTDAHSIDVRLRITPGADADHTWSAVDAELKNVLAKHGLSVVSVRRGSEPPKQSPGGKFRTVIPLQRESDSQSDRT